MEGQVLMSGILHVRWTIASAASVTTPKPILHCRRCDAPRAFDSSGKFRLNANGKRLDAWLVYRCSACSASWNRPVFERRRRGEIEPVMFDALHANDPALAASIADDVAGLSRWASRFEDAGDGAPSIARSVLAGSVEDAVVLRIGIVSSPSLSMRTDRVLALGLDVSRARASDLVGANRVTDGSLSGKPAPRLLRDRATIAVLLDGLADRADLARRAAGIATGRATD